jgi:hypothetical protein
MNRQLEPDLSLKDWLLQFFKILIVIYAVFFVTGLGSRLLSFLHGDGGEYARSLKNEKFYRLRFRELSEEKLSRAEKLGDGYTLKAYFKDVYDLRLYEHAYGLHLFAGFDYRLMSVRDRYVERHPMTREEIQAVHEEVSRFYTPLLEAADAHVNALRRAAEPPHPPEPPTDWLAVICNIIHAYALICLLAVPFYLIRMAERWGVRRVLESAPWWKLPLAAIAWPKYLWKYPAEYLQELLAEAELRRVNTGLFRKITLPERRKIREIVAAGNFISWRKQFRVENAHRLRWSLLTTVCVTFLLMPLGTLAASPPLPMAPPAFRLEIKPVHTVSARDGPSIRVPVTAVPPSILDQAAICPLENDPTGQPSSTRILPNWNVPAACSGFGRSLDHVPLCCHRHSSIGSRIILTPVTVIGEKTHETRIGNTTRLARNKHRGADTRAASHRVRSSQLRYPRQAQHGDSLLRPQ